MWPFVIFICSDISFYFKVNFKLLKNNSKWHLYSGKTSMYLQEDKRWDQYVVSVPHRSTVYVSSGSSQKSFDECLVSRNTTLWQHLLHYSKRGSVSGISTLACEVTGSGQFFGLANGNDTLKTNLCRILPP